MKYVMFEVSSKGMTREFPIIFPDDLVHADVAKHMADMFRRQMGMLALPVSAGFLSSTCLEGLHGKSESLNVESRPGDSLAAKLIDYSHGIALDPAMASILAAKLANQT